MFILFLSDGTESAPFDDTEISPPRKIPSYLMIRKYRFSIALRRDIVSHFNHHKLLYYQTTACHYQSYPCPPRRRHVLMKHHDCRYHAENIAQRHKRIGYAKRKDLQHVHPQQRGQEEKQASHSQLPVDKDTPYEPPRPTESMQSHHGNLHHHLSSGKQCTL